MKKSELRKKIRDLFKEQNLGVLATLGETFPYQSIVAFTVTNDLKNIMFATKRMTSKYKNLKKSPRVSMFIDNRSNRESDFQRTIGLTALGDAQELQGTQRDKAILKFIKRHPCLEEFISSQNSSTFIVKVRVYYLVEHFQEVIEIRTDTWE